MDFGVCRTSIELIIKMFSLFSDLLRHFSSFRFYGDADLQQRPAAQLTGGLMSRF